MFYLSPFIYFLTIAVLSRQHFSMLLGAFEAYVEENGQYVTGHGQSDCGSRTILMRW